MTRGRGNLHSLVCDAIPTGPACHSSIPHVLGTAESRRCFCPRFHPSGSSHLTATADHAATIYHPLVSTSHLASHRRPRAQSVASCPILSRAAEEPSRGAFLRFRAGLLPRRHHFPPPPRPRRWGPWSWPPVSGPCVAVRSPKLLVHFPSRIDGFSPSSSQNSPHHVPRPGRARPRWAHALAMPGWHGPARGLSMGLESWAIACLAPVDPGHFEAWMNSTIFQWNFNRIWNSILNLFKLKWILFKLGNLVKLTQIFEFKS
jgi:hypothetical protein